MKSFLADESLSGEILRVLQGRLPGLDIIRVQDTEKYSAKDPELLEWAAAQNRILITQDKRTIPAYAYARLQVGQTFPGIIVVSREISIKQAAEELHLLIVATFDAEWGNQVFWVPLS
jgi:predicted nuclease of predicted toxin-antitoxin system